MFRPSKIISGGQTGVDRAALDTARECGISIGGWVPAGRKAEDGIINLEAYPELQETKNDRPDARTEANVRDSDATLIIATDIHLTGSLGTKRTREFAHSHDKPVLLLSEITKPPEEQLEELRTWLDQHRPKTLNIAGPRHSEQSNLGKLTRHLLLRLFQKVPEPKNDRLLKLTMWLLIIVNLAITLITFQIEDRLDFGGALIIFFVSLALGKGSHKALRFLTFIFGFITLFSLWNTFYHLLLFKPYEINSGRLLPPDSHQFWAYIVTPSFLTLGLFLLLILVHRQRQIHYFTRTVKRWTIALAAILAFFFLLNLFMPEDQETPELTENQELVLNHIADFYQKHGATPSLAAETSLRNHLQKTDIVGQIQVGDLDSRRRYSSPSTTPNSFSAKKIKTWSNSGEELKIQFNDATNWTGVEYQRAIRVSTNNWLLVRVHLGSYEE